MPELIEAGLVYRAVPPLFGIKKGNSNRYFATKLEFTKYIQKLFSRQYSLTNLNNIPLSNNEASQFFINNIDYRYDLNVLSNIFAIDPYLLEIVLYYIADHINIYPGNISTSKIVKEPIKIPAMAIKKVVKEKVNEEDILTSDESMNDELLPIMTNSVYNTLPYQLTSDYSTRELKSIIKKNGFKFVDIHEKNGCTIIEGLVNSRYQYFFINDFFIKSAMQLLLILKNNRYKYYKMNGNISSLYTIMTTFENLTPSGLTRYKGLGEQNPAQLGESVLRPDSDRMLVRYTMESAKAEIESLRMIDSSMATLINQAKISRQDIE